MDIHPAPGLNGLVPGAITNRGQIIPFYSDDGWHSLRRADLTASSIAGHFGESRWSTPYTDFVDKSGLAEPKRSTAIMDAGRYLEDGIALMIAAEEGFTIQGAGELADDLMAEGVPLATLSPDAPTPRDGFTGPPQTQLPIMPRGAYLRDTVARLGATPDRIILDWCGSGPRPLEIKNVSWQAWKDEWVDGEAPVKYWLQGQIQTGIGRMAGFSWDGFVIGALVAGNETRVLPYDFDPDAFALCQAKSIEFWAEIKAGRQPGPDFWKSADQDAIKRRYTETTPSPLDLTDNLRALEIALRVTELGEVIGAGTKEKEALVSELRFLIGAHEAARLPAGWGITNKTTNRAGFEVKPTAFRTVRFSPPKAVKPANSNTGTVAA